MCVMLIIVAYCRMCFALMIAFEASQTTLKLQGLTLYCIIQLNLHCGIKNVPGKLVILDKNYPVVIIVQDTVPH